MVNRGCSGPAGTTGVFLTSGCLMHLWNRTTLVGMARSAQFHISNPEVVQGSQVRAARALLDWSIPVAADRCRVGVTTISRFEKHQRTPQSAIVREIVRVFEEHGVLFIDTDAGSGVLLIDRATRS